MKKLFSLAFLSLAFAGCASMWQGMGVATTEYVDAQNKKNLEMQQKEMEDIKAQLKDAKAITLRIEQVEILMKDLRDKYNSLPKETLKKIAEILMEAAGEAAAKADSPEKVEKPAK